MTKDFSGCLYVDKGYLSASLKQQLKTMGISLITNIKKKMKPIKQTFFDKAILRR
ncbi:transposase [Arsenophonus sp.]|uniref:transposase n=1 Tax=Arsenophonus sp. TaxID=1872640 RepID=UPI0038790184